MPREIDAFWQADPLDVLRMFERDYGPAFLLQDVIVFPSVGISIGGFHEDYPEGKAIGMDLVGTWDRHVDDMENITFLK